MIETNDEQREFDALSASVGLELLELTRRMHRSGGLDIGEAWEGLSTNNATVVLCAMIRVLEASIALGAIGPGVFEHRAHVIRETFKTLLEQGG
jgi:hypothetical protein